jgi:CheY-like chemotaxis protein
MNDFKRDSFQAGAKCRQCDTAADQPLADKSASVGSAVLPGKGELVLLVDDDDAWVWICQKILSGLGYEVIGYTSPDEALSFFRRQPQLFDLVITDLNMPVLDGITLCAELLKLRSDLPIILMTSGDGTVTRDEIGQTGFRELLLKPTLATTLGRAVQDVLGTLREDIACGSQ